MCSHYNNHACLPPDAGVEPNDWGLPLHHGQRVWFELSVCSRGASRCAGHEGKLIQEMILEVFSAAYAKSYGCSSLSRKGCIALYRCMYSPNVQTSISFLDIYFYIGIKNWSWLRA